jgi:hypothetical protein
MRIGASTLCQARDSVSVRVRFAVAAAFRHQGWLRLPMTPLFWRAVDLFVPSASAETVAHRPGPGRSDAGFVWGEPASSLLLTFIITVCCASHHRRLASAPSDGSAVKLTGRPPDAAEIWAFWLGAAPRAMRPHSILKISLRSRL